MDSDSLNGVPKGLRRSSLDVAWGEALRYLELCLSKMREIDGCDQTVITVCIVNGRRMDTYSLPENECKDGFPAILQLHPTSAAELGSPLSPSPTPSADNFQEDLVNRSGNIDENLEKLTVRQLKEFMTAVRQDLGLKQFSWPQSAQNAYIHKMSGPVPGPRGRAGSRKENLILMFKLSSEYSIPWRNAMNRQIRMLTKSDRGNTDKGGNGRDEMEEKGKDGTGDKDGKKHPNDLPHDPLPNDDLLVAVARNLPRDMRRVSQKPDLWPTVDQLLAPVRHPNLHGSCEWFRQPIDGDGNCLFYTLMVDTRSRGLVGRPVHTAKELRSRLKQFLYDLADAGKPGSSFRREWLVACSHDIEDRHLFMLCQGALQKAQRNCTIQDTEHILAPLRVFVRNWADMVGDSHWGGYLTAELHILASITGTAIESMHKVCRDTATEDRSQYTEVCDTRQRDRMVLFQRRGLFLPIKAMLPSWEEGCYAVCHDQRKTRRGWHGPWPVLRVTLNGQHYDAITSPSAYPIPPEHDDPRNPFSAAFNFSDTLTEPYSSITEEEQVQLCRIHVMIENWERAFLVSEDHARHVDNNLIVGTGDRLKVSELAHLRVPPAIVSPHSPTQNVLMSDDLVTAYMFMLQARADTLRNAAIQRGNVPPPHSCYMNSWLFRSVQRGLIGPAAKRMRQDLNMFDQILLPVILQGHWVLAVCYRAHGVIGVYDPLGHRREDVFNIVKQWAARKLAAPSSGGWTFQQLFESRNCTQKGVIDCGIYICKAAESLGLGIPIRLSQWDIPYVRQKMLAEFLLQRVTPLSWPRS